MTAVVEHGARESSRLEWPVLAAAWVIALAALLAWTTGTPPARLRDELTVAQCWSLDLTVLLGALLAFALRRLARELTRADWAALLMVAAVALGLALGIAPRTNRIFYDEQIYQAIGQNLADLRLAQMCNDGTVEDGRLHCAAGEYNKQPYAYPHLLSVAYRVVGTRPWIAFAVNAAAAGGAAAFVYLLVLLLFDDRVAALLAALLLAFTPEQVVWSGTAAVEPSASCAALAALSATACFIRWRTTAALAGMAVATAWAIQFRPESILVVPVIALLLWQRARDEFLQPRLWWAGLAFLALAAVHVGHLAAVRYEAWGTTHERLSLAYVRDNLAVNGWFYLADRRFPAAWTALAVVGLARPARDALPGRAAILLCFALFFLVTLVFYAGSFDYGADVRYSLATYPALAILGGLGAARLARALERGAPSLPAWPVGAVLVAVQFAWYLPVVRTIADTAGAARADVAFAHSLVPDLRGRTYVLTHNPGMFHLWGISAGQMSLAATNPSHLRQLAARYPDGLFLHWNFWCNVDDPVQRGFCTTTLDRAPGEVVRRHAEARQSFALYRLRPGSNRTGPSARRSP